MHINEEVLVQKSIQGNHQAYGDMVSRYQHQVYNLARRMLSFEEDAKDAAQETFIQAYRSIEHFRE